MHRRPAGASLRRLVVALLLPAVACLAGACRASESEVDPAVARPILEVDACEDVVDLIRHAREQGCQPAPVGELLRPIELLEVVDVDRLRVRSDRGEETVRLAGLRGDDERLPDEVRDALRGPWRDALDGWLRAPGGALFELAAEPFGERGAAADPGYPDLDGRRVVRLARVDAATGERVDVSEEALRRGWALGGHSFEDHLAMDPRVIFAAGERPFAADVPAAQALRAEFVADVLATAAIAPDELQALGARLQAEVAGWLGWEPRAELRFVALDPADAPAVFRPLVEADLDAVEAWLATLDPDVEREPLPPAERALTVEGIVASKVAELHALSPAGEIVYLLRKPEYSRRMLETVLVHEIHHQYQEEVAAAGWRYPPPSTPQGLGEAHAEYLAGRYRAARVDGFERFVATDSHDLVRHFAALLDATGLAPDELYRAYLAGEWSRELWTLLVSDRIGLQELLFRQLGRTEHDSLDFAPLEDEGGGLVVRVTNVSAAPFRGQLHGAWIWSLTSDPTRTVQLASPPCNLHLPPGASVRLRISHQPHWAADPPVGVIGLFSRTPSYDDEGAASAPEPTDTR